MHFDVVSIFPEWFTPLQTSGVVSRAFSKNLASLKLWNPRDFSSTPYKNVDDRPYGGGPGMVMMVEPLDQCLSAVQQTHSHLMAGKSPVFYLSPQGSVVNQQKIKQMVSLPRVVLLCGRYEGVDERVLDRWVDEEISVGDYVLSGGEPAALVLMDAILRLVPGVLNDDLSAQQDSFSDPDLLDYSHYSRPDTYQGQDVPSVLLSGNHAQIAAWRLECAKQNTKNKRPDLWDRYLRRYPDFSKE